MLRLCLARLTHDNSHGFSTRLLTLLQILPMENVNGRKLVESGKLCERKNGRGVDPNRNWDAHWGFKESDYDPAEEFPGAAAFR